jgi:hypothetical protein
MPETPLFESKAKINTSFWIPFLFAVSISLPFAIIIKEKEAIGFLLLTLIGGAFYSIFRNLQTIYKVVIYDKYLLLNQRKISFETITEIRLYDNGRYYFFWGNTKQGNNTTAILLQSPNTKKIERLEVYTDEYSNGVALVTYLEQIEKNRKEGIYSLQPILPEKQNNFVSTEDTMLDIKKTYRHHPFTTLFFYVHLILLIVLASTLNNHFMPNSEIIVGFLLLTNLLLAIYNSYYFELSTHHLIIRNNLLWTYKKVIPFKQIRRVTIHKIHRTEEYVLEILFKNHERCKYNAIYIPKGKLDDLAATLNKKSQ